jgi:prophage antirepressor-like protein
MENNIQIFKRRSESNGVTQIMNVIPEGDIYRLATKSELPSAEAFESWIFDEVLPSIRKTEYSEYTLNFN